MVHLLSLVGLNWEGQLGLVCRRASFQGPSELCQETDSPCSLAEGYGEGVAVPTKLFCTFTSF